MKEEQAFDKYADMLDLPHHTSIKHPRMTMHDRAAQFSPFAALTGHDAAIQETARLTETQVQLDESRIGLLNQKINDLIMKKDSAPEVTITYFMDDFKKEGGMYLSKTGRFKGCNKLRNVLITDDLTEIPLDNIYDISSDVFDSAKLF